LQESGAVNVMVSCGGDGLILFDEHGDRHQVPPHQGTVVNTVGAGDSTVAGFLYGIQNGFSYAECARFANACGAATAFSDDLATREKIEILYKG
jgi:1-phosphofructokinase